MYLDELKRRTEELKRAHPYIEELLDLFYIIRSEIEKSRKALGTLTLQDEKKNYKGKANALMPMIDPSTFVFSLDPVKDLFVIICDIIISKKSAENKEEIERLSRAVAAGTEDFDGIIRKLIHPPMEEAEGLPSYEIEKGILTFIAVNTSKPIALSMRDKLKGLVSLSYDEGFCPVCGTYPSIGGHLGEEGKLYLLCSLCEHLWPHPRMRCYFCKNDDQKKLKYFSVEADTRPLRVNICEKCKNYLKIFESRGEGKVFLEVEDVASIHLDILAGKEGYIKPSHGVLGLHSL